MEVFNLSHRDPTVHKRLKVFCLINDIPMHKVVSNALEAYLNEHEDERDIELFKRLDR